MMVMPSDKSSTPLSTKAKVCIALAVYCVVLISTCHLAVKYQALRWAVSAMFSLGERSVPNHLRQYLKFEEGYVVPHNEVDVDGLRALRAAMDAANYKREVFNCEVFGPVQSDTTMLVVQVRRDAERLQYLVMSLAQVRGIENVVVIFSHSYFDESINRLIESINYCRYMQIFYPFSTQLYPTIFPGVDPTDCMHPSSQRRTDVNCSSRDAHLAEYKHHWWWQARFVFDHLKWSSRYTGTVIFLEEDDCVLPDILSMLYFAKRAQFIIPRLNVIAFGTPYEHSLDYDKLKIGTWQPSYHKGIAFNKTVWKNICNFSSHYCMYNDIKWSNSLLNVFAQFSEGFTDVVATVVPRIISTGAHASGKQAFADISTIVNSANLFPNNVKAIMSYSRTGIVQSGLKPLPRGNGGWSDIRDQLMCMNYFSLNEASSITII